MISDGISPITRSETEVPSQTEPSGIVFNIQRYSTHDGPGIRTTIFLKGCPLHCWWCHNPESQSSTPEILFRPERCIGCGDCQKACPATAIFNTEHGFITLEDRCQHCGRCAEVCPTLARELIGRRMTVNALLAEVRRDRVFFDQSGGGITLSGGEPMAQPKFLCAFLRACHLDGLHTAVETCGYAPPEVLRQVAEDTDLFLYDLKLMNPERHSIYTGVSSQLILENLCALSRRGAHTIVRIPVIPGINDQPENLRPMGEFLSGLRIEAVHLLPYHASGVGKYQRLGRPYLCASLHAPSKDAMEKIAEVFTSFGLNVKIGG